MPSSEVIVVPWDFSEHAVAALSYARENFVGQTIVVICVLEPPNPYAPGFHWGPEAKESAKQSCLEEFGRTTGLSSEVIRCEVVFGEPADEISRFSQEVEASQIVMSTHGRTGLQRLLMGSVAQRVVAKATCPVLLLPTKWVFND